jgi:ribose transport system substrate-binding protein
MLMIVALFGALTALLPAVGDEPKPVKIGVVTNCTADFWSVCEAGAHKAAADLKVDLTFRQPEKAFDTSAQMPIVEAWAKRGFNGIAVAVIDPEAQAKDLKRIAETVPVLTFDNDAPESGRLAHVGTDNYEAGKAVGRLVKRALPKGGTVAIFIGSTKSANGKARAQGVLDELAGEKDAKGEAADHPTTMKKVRKFGKYFLADGEVTEDGGPQNATKSVNEVLARLDGVTDVCLVGLYAYNPPAILKATKQRKLVGKVKIVGFDEDFDTLEAVAKGQIEATVVQDPFMYGYRVVEILAAKARGADKLPKQPIPYRVLTKDGGPDETVGGVTIKNLKATEYQKQLQEWIESAKAKE